MTSKPLSAAREDYLRAILRLQEKKDRYATTTETARYLHLSKSTVSERLKDLMRDGLVVPDKYSAIRLTARGYKLAQSITFKHRILEVFLHSTLKIPRSKVHAEAHRLEHGVSDAVALKLKRFLGNPKRDPHGIRIPTLKS
ncbi:MAG: metal-dependent transcriptional regulator [bacterium]|nr:metal-dependent transcriptional regulator [bacterium]